jgi:hypothetical protein
LKILIVGNSVSNPPFAGAPSYPALLAEALGPTATIDTIIRSGETIEHMEAGIVRALASGPDWLVLQVGINECAPRPLSVAERARLSALRPAWLQRQIIRVIHRWRPSIIRARALHQFTPLPDFVASVRRVLAVARSARVKVLVLPITTVTTVAERRTPFTNREVGRYNAALLQEASSDVRVATQLEVFGTDDASALVAGPETVHLSPAAHAQLAGFVAEALAAAPADAAAVRR